MSVLAANSTQHNATRYDDDAKLQHPAEKFTELVPWVVKNYGKNGISIAREIAHLFLGPGRLHPLEYFWYQLYDDNKYTAEQKLRFVSDQLHLIITKQCSDPKWDALTEDKWASYQFLRAAGFPVPQTLAVIDQTIRSFGADLKISSPAQLKQFLRQTKSYPLFGKANTGLGSFGAFILIGLKDNNVLFDHCESLTFEQLFERVIGARTFLLQTCIQNHPTIRSFSKYCATVRSVNLVGLRDVITPFTVLKIPSSANIADNYWRQGNLLADVDPETGIVRRVIRGQGIHLEELTHHPETGVALVGMTLPHWGKLRELNHECARLFAPVRYQSLDIAIADDGPVIVEINTGGAFNLAQLASGSGLLTDDVRSFFESCGYKFKSLIASRRP